VECARSTWTDAQKKTQHAAEQDRPDVAEARAAWRECQPDMNAARLVFIDETWATTNMARRYGRAPRGERVIASVPYGHWKTSTFVAGLRYDGITAPLVIDGAMNGTIFLAYVEQFLAPTLEPGDIVIMDNLQPQSHWRAGSNRSVRCKPDLLASLLARSQSNRTGVCNAQGTAAKGRRTHSRGALDHHRRKPLRILPNRMRKLSR